MVRESLLFFLLLSAIVLPIHNVQANLQAQTPAAQNAPSVPAFADMKPELQDPVWTALNDAFNQALSKLPCNTIMGDLFGLAAYDALSVYSDKLEGLVVGGELRRPPQERTIDNKRTAIAFATYRVLAPIYGTQMTDILDPTFANLNLNPNDTSMDPTTAVGIGNIVGMAVLKSPYNDRNELGNDTIAIGSRRSTPDSPVYVPKNTPYKLSARSRWQPLEVIINNEYPAVQMYTLHKIGQRPLVTGYHPSYFDIPKPTDSLRSHSAGYRAQADRVLAISATLNDTSKMLAEGIDNLFGDDGYVFLVNKYNWDLDLQVIWCFVNVMCVREAIITAVNWKTFFDTIRPVSVIRSSGLYVSASGLHDTVTAWAGPDLGTREIKASDFQQYNSRTDPSPEYPSGACTYYSTYATVASKFFGTNEFGWSKTFSPGSSHIEQNTPKETVEFIFPTFESLKQGAMDGREFGLVHFEFAVEQGKVLGEALGAELHKKLASLIKADLLV